MTNGLYFSMLYCVAAFEEKVEQAVTLGDVGITVAAGILDGCPDATPWVDVARRGLAGVRLTTQSPDTCTAKVFAGPFTQP